MSEQLAEQKLLERITASPNILGGKPIVRDRQLSVEQVLGELATGDTIGALLDRHVGLEREDIQACLIYARQLVQQESASCSIEDLIALVPEILKQAPYIKLLVLFGSRARGDANQNSDWDFAFLCDEEQRKHYEKGGWDAYRIWGILQTTYGLGDDQIDVIDLRNASALLAHSVVRDGSVIYESESGKFEALKQQKLLSSEQIKQMRRELRNETQRRLSELQQ